MRFVKMFSAMAMMLAASVVIFYAASRRAKLKEAHPQNDEISSTVAANQTTSKTLHANGSISGRVLDADGGPVQDVIVTAENIAVTTRNLPRAETNRRGEFTIQGLTPGQYELYTKKEKDGYPRTEFNLYNVGGIPTPQVAVFPQQTTQGITMQLGPKAAVLTGQVVDAVTKRPLNHADITVRRVDLPDRFLRTGLSLPVELGEFKLLVPSVALTVKVSETGYEDWYYDATDDRQRTSSLLLRANSTRHLLIALRPTKPSK